MSEHELDASLVDKTDSGTPTKILLKVSPNGNIFIDWSDLPRPRNVRQCIIHYKSLNNNRSHTIRVSRKTNNGYLKKIESGHLYEVHVCAVDSANKIIASSQRARIQTKTSNDAPRLRVTKSTPDFIWLEWEKSDDIQVADIHSYKIVINGQTKVVLPSTENRYVVNDGQTGQRYIFQVEMLRKDGKNSSSIPVNVAWPGVTIPKSHAIVNGSEELIVCWGDSTSINDGNIESYTLHLLDSEGRLLSKVGPNSVECRQVWIKDVVKGIYVYILEIKLANSTKSISSPPMTIECGRESRLPILSYTYTDSNNEKQLVDMAYRLINIRDNMKTKRQLDKCENLLKQILSMLTHLSDSVRLNLMIESKSARSILQTYRLLIDDEESNITMPGSTKQFALELPRSDRPYELAILVTPDLYGTKSKKVLVEASGQFSFFCAHFDQHKSTEGCSYMETLPLEKQSMNQGLLKSFQMMDPIEVYDVIENKKLELPQLGKVRRLSILFFYMNQCIPSMTHLNYFATYASNHRAQHNYISINCTQNDLTDLKELTKDLTDIQCYTDFSSEEFEYEKKENEKPIHEILSISGVPTYFVLDFSSRIVWKGRLCTQNQLEYDAAIDHIVAEVNKFPCSPDKCQLCQYRSMDETRIKSELNEIDGNLHYLIQQRFARSENKKEEGEKQNRTRTIVSLKNGSSNKLTYSEHR